MKKVNHLNYYDNNDCFYCEKRGVVISLKIFPNFHEDECHDCPMLNGFIQGQGVECLYEDVTDEPFIVVGDPDGFAEKRRARREMKHVIEPGRGE